MPTLQESTTGHRRRQRGNFVFAFAPSHCRRPACVYKGRALSSSSVNGIPISGRDVGQLPSVDGMMFVRARSMGKEPMYSTIWRRTSAQLVQMRYFLFRQKCILIDIEESFMSVMPKKIPRMQFSFFCIILPSNYPGSTAITLTYVYSLFSRANR